MGSIIEKKQRSTISCYCTFEDNIRGIPIICSLVFSILNHLVQNVVETIVPFSVIKNRANKCGMPFSVVIQQSKKDFGFHSALAI